MKSKILLIFFVIFICLSNTCYYSAVNSNDRDLKQKFVLAVKMINSRNYRGALKHFLELDAQKSTANIQYHIGLCYLNSPERIDRSMSINYFEKALPNVSTNYAQTFEEINAPIETYYYLAEAYLGEYQADKSINFLSIYKKLASNDKNSLIKIENEIQKCNQLKTNFVFSEKSTYQISRINRQALNTGTNPNDYSKSLLLLSQNNKLIYTTQNDKIILITQNNSGKWENPVEIAFEENQSNVKNPNEKVFLSTYKTQKGDIYLSNFINNKLTTPIKLNENINTKFDETSASLSFDGNILYFSSNRKGGYGGFDIYKAEKLESGEWGKATNLGPTVNTDKDEITPFILPDGVTLYFSSKGHSAIGGFDIFVTTQSEEGFWEKSENLGFPINTVEDDFNYFVSSNDKFGFYISSKNNSGLDIYQVDLTAKNDNIELK
ncbi:MAG: hypothetical protein WCK02_07680 [Bacteroidota bacterium]